ncbi:MAG TPA: adenylate kinase [Candidatus Acidoferrales bacterium]|nr:adenylate kinase [Candidatus Acidoferrales bacterium]
MRILMFGPPGSGKGTYASRLSVKLNTPHISTGDLVRDEIKKQTDLGKRISDYSSRGQLVPDKTICELLQKRISQPDCNAGFILDGFPRTIPQAQELSKISTTDLIINLNVPDAVIIERLSTRLTCKSCGAVYNERTLKPKTEGKCDKCQGNLYKREDDQPTVIQERLNVYRKQTQPLLEYYQREGRIRNVTNKEASVPPEKIVQEILNIIEKEN